jgi:ribosomal RNA small subunit methyltransferase A
MNPFLLKNKDLIRKYNILAEKKYSQNFIIDKSLTDKIAKQLINIDAANVIEIGSGPLTLTRSLLELPVKKINLIELDKKFTPLYMDIAPYYTDKLDYYFADILEFDLEKLGDNLHIISNLPYKISSPFLVKACKNYQIINQMVIMLQKEVATRIIAKSGSKEFGRLSIMLQSFFEINKIMDLKPEAFFPKPKISSTILHFSSKRKLPNDIEFHQFEDLTKILFSQRRKKIGTILKNLDIEKIRIDVNKRPENLELEEFYNLVRFLNKSANHIKNN